MNAKFRLGKIVSTPNALEKITQDDISMRAIGRHQETRSDWGEVSEDDRAKNELSLTQGSRLWSVYHAGSGAKFWLITEGNRSFTTVLMPEDY